MNSSTVLCMARRQFCRPWSTTTTTTTTTACQSYLHGLGGINTICCNYLSSSPSSLLSLGQLNHSRTPNILVNNNNNHNKNPKLLLPTSNSSLNNSNSYCTKTRARTFPTKKVYGAKKEEEFVIVKKAMIFTRSFQEKTLDGVITDIISDGRIIIDFGNFQWLCEIPRENKLKVRLNSHVRGTKVDPADSDKVSRSSVMVLVGTKFEDGPWYRSQFPWRLSPLEKNVFYITLTSILVGLICTMIVVIFVGAVMSVVRPGVREHSLFSICNPGPESDPPEAP